MSRFNIPSKSKIKDEESNQTIEQVLGSSSWSERKHGYEAVQAIFKNLESRSPNWERYAFLIPAVAQERNVPAQEKGLEAIAIYAEKCDVIDDQTVTLILNDVTKRYLADSKPKIRDLACQICTAFLDKRKNELVMDMLYQCLESRNPKQVFASIRTLTTALKRSGPTAISIQVTMPKIVDIINKSKAMFQQDVKDLYTELYSWIGPDIRGYMLSLDSSLAKTLETEFTRVAPKGRNSQKSSIVSDASENSQTLLVKTRAKSAQVNKMPSSAKSSRPASSLQQRKKSQVVSPRATRQGIASARLLTKTDSGPCGEVCSPRRSAQSENHHKIDIDSVLLMMERKQWSERKEGLDDLMKLILSNDPIGKFNFDRIIKSLRHLILNDTNVLLIAKAVHCVSALAKTQDEELFRVHAPLMMTLLLEKFKEKKSVIIEAIREATDAIYSSIAFGYIARYVALSLDNQNPSVRSETELFLCRCFSKPTESLLKPAMWQPLANGLIANLSNQDQTVRENSMKALGTMVKVLDEQKMQPYIGNLQRHQRARILQHGDAAVIEFKTPTVGEVTDTSTVSLNMPELEQLTLARGRQSRTLSAKPQASETRNRLSEPKSTRLSPRGRPAVATAYSVFHENAMIHASDEYKAITSSLSPGEEEFYDAEELNDKSREPSARVRGRQGLRQNNMETVPEPSMDSRKNSLILTTRQTNVRSVADSSSSKPNDSARKKKPLSPSAQQRLSALRNTVENLKTMWNEMHTARGERPPMVSLNIEEEISQKLENLETYVDKCFSEIKMLSPLLYEELIGSQSQTDGGVLRSFNDKLKRMEKLLKSLTFEEDVMAAGSRILTPRDEHK